jgi:cation diffusion facilitator family transporter
LALLSKLILRIFVPGYETNANPVIRTRIGQLEAWVSIVINAVLTAVKLALGIAINSLSLIADGVHTLSDVATSAVVLVGFRVAGKPADKEHPFGHGRVEYVATLIIAVMLGVVGFEFIKSAVGRLLSPVELDVSWGVLLAIGLTIVVKVWLGQFSSYLGRLIDSSALKADAWHHTSDAISSVLVLIAVGGSSLGYPALDGIGGVLVGVYLIWSGIEIAKDVIDPLLGAPPSAELIHQVRDLCRAQENVVDAHDITIHNYGHHKFMALHIEVSDRLSAHETHDIAEEIAKLMRQKLGAYATVHIDPIDTEGNLVQEISKQLNQLIEQSESILGFHDLRIVNTPDHLVILVEMTLSPDLTKNKQSMTKRSIQKELLKSYPQAEVDISISPLHTYR